MTGSTGARALQVADQIGVITVETRRNSSILDVQVLVRRLDRLGTPGVMLAMVAVAQWP